MNAKQARLFIAYIAPGNRLGLTRFQRCVVSGVAKGTLSKSLRATLAHHVTYDKLDTLRLWATGRGSASRRYFENASSGDQVAFIVGDRVVAVALVIGKCESQELAEVVWGTDWFSLFYFLANVRTLNASRDALTDALGYKSSMKFRGLMVVSEEAAKRVLDDSGSLASFLRRAS